MRPSGIATQAAPSRRCAIEATVEKVPLELYSSTVFSTPDEARPPATRTRPSASGTEQAAARGVDRSATGVHRLTTGPANWARSMIKLIVASTTKLGIRYLA